jgi:radical SAM superfamily enzyme YgiQ (UPF0313 family)
MPVGLASTIASVRNAGFEFQLIDAFGESPKNKRLVSEFMVLGLTENQIVEKIKCRPSAFFIYANQLINHSSLISISKKIKLSYPKIPIIILENTQAVTAYSLKIVKEEFFKNGIDYILVGEAEIRILSVISGLLKNEDISKCDGLCSPVFENYPKANIADLDLLPFPAWDLFPIQNYWNLGFAHGPLTTKKYFPLLTSRGCPYPCKFCVVPSTNLQRWRSRSAASIVNEIEQLVIQFGVTEFHLEDLDPTVNEKRTIDICNEIINRKINIIWKIVAGTKVETIKNISTIELMAKSGCKYISISPESGSSRVLKLMAKPFDIDHSVKLIHAMNNSGIKSQACFVLGFPGETDSDLHLTKSLLKKLTKEGLDEVAIFIISPVPGSAIFSQMEGYSNLSELNFSPVWRDDYVKLSKFRKILYINFLTTKLIFYPFKIFRQFMNFISGRYETKMEMVPYKALIWKITEFF